MLDLVLALALAAIAAAIVAYVVALVARAAGLPPLGGWLAGNVAGRSLARHVARAREADRHIAAGDRDAALRALRAAFYLGAAADARRQAEVAAHHTGLLSRLLALTAEPEHAGVRLLSLAKVDRLLQERAVLQRRRLQARGDAVAGIDRRLRDNAGDLGQALDQLVAEVAALPRRHRVH